MLAKAKHSVSAFQRETVPFLGLNRSDNTQEGEFSEQKNMSDRRYPFLAPRLPRAQKTGEENMQGLFCWDGHEVVAAGGTLYLDGTGVFDVSDGPKQFAVVNTKLVVWPDCICVDLTKGKAEMMEVKVKNNGEASVEGSSLTLEAEHAYTSTKRNYHVKHVCVWTYSAVSWDEETKQWTLEGRENTRIERETCENTGLSIKGRYFFPDFTYNPETNSYSNFKLVDALDGKTPGEKMNEFGIYGRFEDYFSEYEDINGVRFYWKVGIYRSDHKNAPLGDVFHVGDIVEISGSLYGYHNVDGVKITEISEDGHTLCFADGTFRGGTAITRLSEDVNESDEKHQVRYNDGEEYRCYNTVTETGRDTFVSAKAGQYLLLDIGLMRLAILDDEFNELNYYMVKATNTDLPSYRVGTLTSLATTAEKITVERKIPTLDYICEHENRLWGVSNADKTIYASALGDPYNFYDYSGDAGGYDVAVGSEGDFTGICSYGNAVLCWKERTLHKVLGDLPSNYQTAVYRFAGVRAGAHKSLVNVNETLFFLGADGVYAYTGNKPSLISRALGADVLKDGVGGTDGRAYYLSALNGEAWELLTYDTHTGLWMRSDETQVVDFARSGDALKFLSGDSVYTIGSGDEAVEWEAVFVPMYETLEGGKQYNRLIFRVEVPGDSWLAVDVRFDGGRWIQVGIVKGKSGPVHMPVPLRRCDKFQIRLRGKGDCTVLEMVREFRLRGDG